jgi:hypothetical protein
VNVEQHEAPIRIQALSFLEWLVVQRSKTLAKQRLLPHILKTLFHVLASETSVDDEDEDDDAAREQPAFYCIHVLDCIAAYIPPEIVFPSFVRF